MKTLLFLVTILAASTLPLSAKGVAAKDAMRTLARERGASWLERIVQLNGDRGQDQPAAWHIVAGDGNGGLREFFVGIKGILSEGPVPPAVVPQVQGPPLRQKKFTLDSTMAFMKANEAAKKALIGFDSATYRLRAGQSGAAAWYMQLNNAAGQKVGEVVISAVSGRVTQILAFTPLPPQPPPAPRTVPPALVRTKEAVTRGTESVGRGLSRAGEWISRKFSPQPAPPPYYVPPPVR